MLATECLSLMHVNLRFSMQQILIFPFLPCFQEFPKCLVSKRSNNLRIQWLRDLIQAVYMLNTMHCCCTFFIIKRGGLKVRLQIIRVEKKNEIQLESKCNWEMLMTEEPALDLLLLTLQYTHTHTGIWLILRISNIYIHIFYAHAGIFYLTDIISSTYNLQSWRPKVHGSSSLFYLGLLKFFSGSSVNWFLSLLASKFLYTIEDL